MRFNTKILIFVLLLSLCSGVCLGADTFYAKPFTAFYLESALGNRTLANESLTTSQVLQPRKSPNEAFLYSLVIPGMGQLYTGAKHGYLYTAAEVGFLATYFILRNSGSNIRDDWYDDVREGVAFIGPGSFEAWNDEDFEHATQYETWNHVYDSDATRARTGKWFWKDIDPSLKDQKHGDFEVGTGSKQRPETRALRDKSNDTFERARFFFGLAILNHVISAVEARITTKRVNARLERTAAQVQTRMFDIDIKTDVLTGATTGAFVLRKRF